MANAYVGNPYALVFPIDCDGFLKIPYSTNTDDTEPTLWSNGSHFTIESTFTPYDVNGNGQNGKGKVLENTGPADDYQNDITDRFSHKMMLFSNGSIQFYLQNTTNNNVNQPAEYKLCAKVGTETLESDAVIKPVNTLHGYYDQNGFYVGRNTSLTKITANATQSLETATITVLDDLTSFANAHATGSLTIPSSFTASELYTQGTERTASITVSNQPTFPNTLDGTSGPATGGVDFNTKTPPISVLSSRDTSKKITIPSTSSTSFNFYFFLAQSNSTLITGSNGTAINDNKFSPGTGFGTMTASFNAGSQNITNVQNPSLLQVGMSISGTGIPNNTTITGVNTNTSVIGISNETTSGGSTITFGSTDYTSNDIAVISSVNTAAGFAAALHAAVNEVNTNNSSFSISSFYSNGDVEIALFSDTSNSSFNENVTIGNSFDSGISVSGLSGGLAASTNINEYLTITIKTGSSSTVARNFKYYPSSPSNSYSSGNTTTTANGTTVYRVVVGNDTDATASNLRTAINAAFTNTQASASVSNSTVTVTQKYVGSGFGSGSSVAETSAYSAGGVNSLHTISAFTSGTQASDTTYNKFIKIGTNYFSPCDFSTGNNDQRNITDGSNTVTTRLFRGDLSRASNTISLDAKIDASFDPDIISSIDTLNGIMNFQLSDFTPSMSISTNLTGMSTTSITGGQELDAYISITDADGTLRKYKPSTLSTESTGTTDGTYVFFEATSGSSATAIQATAAELELAIESEEGHDGSLSVSGLTDTLTLLVTTVGPSEQIALDSTYIDSTNDVSFTSFVGNSADITIDSDQTDLLDVGSRIYDSNGNFLSTVSAVNGTVITLSDTSTPFTSTLYKEQPKEALYVNNLYKASCTLDENGRLRIYLNNGLLGETSISNFTFEMANEDCFIGQDGTNINTQFMGEIYEIGMKKGVQPCTGITTLNFGYSDIIFYYRFGDDQ